MSYCELCDAVMHPMEASVSTICRRCLTKCPGKYKESRIRTIYSPGTEEVDRRGRSTAEFTQAPTTQNKAYGIDDTEVEEDE